MQIAERRSSKRNATEEDEEKGDAIQSAVLHSLQTQHGGSSTPSSKRRRKPKWMQIAERKSWKRKATEEDEEEGDDIQSAVLHSLQTQYGGSSTPRSRRWKKNQVDADCRAQIFENESDSGG